MSQWAMYFLPSIVAWIRLRMGKKIHLSLGFLILLNLLVAWTVIGWILLMLNAFGYNPVTFIGAAPDAGRGRIRCPYCGGVRV